MAFDYKECRPKDNHKYCPYGVARRCESSCALYDNAREMCAHMIIAQTLAKQLEEEELERERQELKEVKHKAYLANKIPGYLDEALNSDDGTYKP